ncbi:hypothetical protein HELRODRAFT_93054, partial [Helobdella robusta]|uniref:Uncharacterized protein n=1 Tax=Helobdella robusta TaxID=6412 RepID=T1G8S2_HELRO
VMNRWEKVKQQTTLRLQKLNDSKDYQQFLLAVHDVTSWINEKMQTALDESYNDPSNLQGKIQKNQAFQAEVLTNRSRVDVVMKEGDKFVSKQHYASDVIREKMMELEGLWKDLLDATEEKKRRLLEAYEVCS